MTVTTTPLVGLPAPPFVQAVNDPQGRMTKLIKRLREVSKLRGRFALALGSTHTSDHEGISAAGADGQARRLTPAIDAEALVKGAPLSAPAVPVSPEGIVSPVVASRAMVSLLNCRIEVFDCGAFETPKVDAVRVGDGPARCLESGSALDQTSVQRLFRAGQSTGSCLSGDEYLLIGECVPAGTSTACAVLTALGYAAASLVSSSMPSADRSARGLLVDCGIRRSALDKTAVANSPLLAVAALGDPMQPFVAGLALEASRRMPVILGGGTQMLAVFALLKAIIGADYLRTLPICVMTTKWVAFDKSAGAAELARLVGAPLAAACPDFTLSRHAGLRAYEKGNVKEGVAVGALMAMANLRGYDPLLIQQSIDLQYDRMVSR